ncbi:MAG: cupin domain-containing protein [Spirochaetaceae bacterium]|nr:MAG: cupin domain-containing protein [Spirochaetaceae bacterium]
MQYLNQAKSMIRKRPVPGLEGTMIHGESMTVASWTFVAGTALPEHSHPHEQIALVVEGELELTIGGDLHVLRSGDAAVIPGGTPHSARAVTICRVMDTFHPVREDFR